ncbi:DUF521 domain-containing protein [candidate division KSB1 bacterium]|nr:DUF521 domain-containing protein [candidate division KSB1 bacterium]
MKLTDEEQAILLGEGGRGAQKAMEILVALGKIYRAFDMVPVQSAQIAGVSYRNIGDPGVEFLADWVQLGAKVAIPAFMNPAGIDRKLWKQMGVDAPFAKKQMKIISHLEKMNIEPTLTCTPYHIGHVPQFGEHIAWSESSAVSFANSVLGARTNREGGPSALAAAIVGRTPRFGLHLDENRLASHHITVKTRLSSPADYGALGYWIGKQVGGGIPYIEGLAEMNGSLEVTEYLKALGAAMAASGAVALYHIQDVTPEAVNSGHQLLKKDHIKIRVEQLNDAYQELKKSGDKLDLVALGCPHHSLEEIRAVAQTVAGRKFKVEFWITTSYQIRQSAAAEGWVQLIESAGGKVISDTCMVVAPLKEAGFNHIAVNSAKAACYLPSHQGAVTYWGTTEQCIQAAIEGKWKF